MSMLMKAVAVISGGTAGGVIGDIAGLGEMSWFKDNNARPLAVYFLFGALALLTPTMIKKQVGKFPIPLIYFFGAFSMGVAINMYRNLE